jgi:hypothetical protein
MVEGLHAANYGGGSSSQREDGRRPGQQPARLEAPMARAPFGGGRPDRQAAFSRKYAALISMYFCHSAGTMSSGVIASTGQASTQASQSMHCSGSM